MVGGNETPAGFPGMAHAQEHMAFRGCTGMSADQTAAIYAELGGQNNADTQQNITQYFATVPAADLDVALQAQAACLQGIDDSQAEWDKERGAIEQEVARDLSNPTYKFIDRLEPGHVRGHALRARSSGHQGLFRRHHGRDAANVLPQLVCAWKRHSRHRRRRRSARRRWRRCGACSAPSRITRFRRTSGELQAREVRDLHPGQQPSLCPRLHRLSISGNELDGLRRRRNPRGRSDQPAGGSVWDGAGGQGARGRIRRRRAVHPGERGYGVVALPAGADAEAPSRKCAAS